MQIGRQLRAHNFELVALEEPGAHVVLGQHRNMWLREDPACLVREGVRALQSRQFSIDRGVRCAVQLSLTDVAIHLGRCHSRRSEMSEARTEVSHEFVHPPQ